MTKPAFNGGLAYSTQLVGHDPSGDCISDIYFMIHYSSKLQLGSSSKMSYGRESPQHESCIKGSQH